MELEKELKELDEMEATAKVEKVIEVIKEKPKVLKLTFKEKIALEKLPLVIEELDAKIEEKNSCLSDPKCYEEVGLSTLAKELAEIEKLYEQKMEELFLIEEKVEEIENS